MFDRELASVEMMRQMLYGYDPLTPKTSEIF